MNCELQIEIQIQIGEYIEQNFFFMDALKSVLLKFTQVSCRRTTGVVHHINNKHVPQRLRTSKCLLYYLIFLCLNISIVKCFY